MSTDRTARLGPQDVALKLACTDAVHAAGGQVFVGREVGRTQGRMSDYCSVNTTEFMPLAVARRVDALGAGSPGHPHIARALARSLGIPLESGRPAAPADGEQDLGDWLCRITREFSDLTGHLSGEDLAAGCDALGPTARGRLSREADQLADQVEAFRAALAGAVLAFRRSNSS